MKHHPTALEICVELKKLDHKNGFPLDLKFGGDGDNGQYLLEWLSIIFNKVKCPHCKSTDLGKPECTCNKCGKCSIYEY